MKKIDIELMEVALKAIYRVCAENHGKDCADCPAKGKGKLCHSGDISCCAPHGWWGIESKEEENEQAN